MWRDDKTEHISFLNSSFLFSLTLLSHSLCIFILQIWSKTLITRHRTHRLQLNNLKIKDHNSSNPPVNISTTCLNFLNELHTKYNSSSSLSDLFNKILFLYTVDVVSKLNYIQTLDGWMMNKMSALYQYQNVIELNGAE